MNGQSDSPPELPTIHQIRQAVELFIIHAYDPPPPEKVAKFIPPDDANPRQWLMSSLVERDPPDAPLENVRSFVLRIGNRNYPHMKLRLSRPPKDSIFLFSVDCHDAFLVVPPESLDYLPLEELKRHNAVVAEAVRLAWEQVGLPTERNYLRAKIKIVRDGMHRETESLG